MRAGEAQDVGHRVYHLIHAGDLGIYIVGSDLQLAAKVAVFGVDRANIGFRVKGAAAVDNDIGRVMVGAVLGDIFNVKYSKLEVEITEQLWLMKLPKGP